MLTNREKDKIMLHFLNKEEMTIGELHHCGITNAQIHNACLTEQLLKVRSGINPFAKEGSQVFSYLSGKDACRYLQEKMFSEDIILKPDFSGDNVLFLLEKEDDAIHRFNKSISLNREIKTITVIGVIVSIIGVIISMLK